MNAKHLPPTTPCQCSSPTTPAAPLRQRSQKAAVRYAHPRPWDRHRFRHTAPDAALVAAPDAAPDATPDAAPDAALVAALAAATTAL